MGKAWTTLALIAAPILLVHGYSEDSHVWDLWKGWLQQDGFKQIEIPTFSQDQCGNVGDHAAELAKMIGGRTVDIVGHSQGGLTARWYISHYPNHVKHLIMIGTPNQGTPAAWLDLTNCPFSNSNASGLEDLRPGSAATQVPDNSNTSYYALAGNLSSPCFVVIEKATCYTFGSDGFVTTQSALSHYKSLGIFQYNHQSLLKQKDVYEKVLSAIK